MTPLFGSFWVREGGPGVRPLVENYIFLYTMHSSERLFMIWTVNVQKNYLLTFISNLTNSTTLEEYTNFLLCSSDFYILLNFPIKNQHQTNRNIFFQGQIKPKMWFLYSSKYIQKERIVCNAFENTSQNDALSKLISQNWRHFLV